MSDKDLQEKDKFLASLGLTGVKGLLNIWILSLLNKKHMNGYEIVKEISDATKHHWEPKAGSLYPALHKLQKKGLIKSSKAGIRHQIVYSLTPKGKKIVIELRNKIADVHSKHKFRQMFETIIWPDESNELRREIDILIDGLSDLRNSKKKEKEKIHKIRAASKQLE